MEMNEYRWEMLSNVSAMRQKKQRYLYADGAYRRRQDGIVYGICAAPLWPGMKHIIYVIPYTSIIRGRTRRYLKEILGEYLTCWSTIPANFMSWRTHPLSTQYRDGY